MSFEFYLCKGMPSEFAKTTCFYVITLKIQDVTLMFSLDVLNLLSARYNYARAF